LQKPNVETEVYDSNKKMLLRKKKAQKLLQQREGGGGHPREVRWTVTPS